MPSVHLSAIDNSQSAIPSVAGSPLWQAVFVSFAVLLILFEVVHGWRLGLVRQLVRVAALAAAYAAAFFGGGLDRKSTRLNSSHTVISYAVFCLKKKKTTTKNTYTSGKHTQT